jgi:hypothetical protein
MARLNKKIINVASEDEPPLGENRGLTKDASQDANSSKIAEAKEQRLRELEEQVLTR